MKNLQEFKCWTRALPPLHPLTSAMCIAGLVGVLALGLEPCRRIIARFTIFVCGVQPNRRGLGSDGRTRPMPG